MTLHAASRQALGEARARLDEVLAEQATEPASLGTELFSFVELLGTEIPLRRAVADASSAPQARTELVRGLLRDKLSEPTLRVLDSVVAARWSSPRELLDGVENLARGSLLVRAERDGALDVVEGELFQAGRLIAGHTDLERALADHGAPNESKRTLVRSLFADTARPVTVTLVEHAVVLRRGRNIVTILDDLAAQAAERRDRSVAHVVSASELSEQQRQQLADKLQRIYGRQMALHVEVDPGIQGGLVVKVGDEVIDGSAAARLAALRRKLAG